MVRVQKSFLSVITEYIIEYVKVTEWSKKVISENIRIFTGKDKGFIEKLSDDRGEWSEILTKNNQICFLNKPIHLERTYDGKRRMEN